MLSRCRGSTRRPASRGATSRGYTVAAKTGTAQVSDARPSKCLCQYGSSYIGIAPGRQPAARRCREHSGSAKGKYYGDEVAGPAFYDVMKFALQTMKIAPTMPGALYPAHGAVNGR